MKSGVVQMSILLTMNKHHLHSAHCRWVQIFYKDLKKRLIYLGYLRTKYWKYLVRKKDARANINSVELKFAKLRR